MSFEGSENFRLRIKEYNNPNKWQMNQVLHGSYRYNIHVITVGGPACAFGSIPPSSFSHSLSLGDEESVYHGPKQ